MSIKISQQRRRRNSKLEGWRMDFRDAIDAALQMRNGFNVLRILHDSTKNAM